MVSVVADWKKFVLEYLGFFLSGLSQDDQQSQFSTHNLVHIHANTYIKSIIVYVKDTDL